MDKREMNSIEAPTVQPVRKGRLNQEVTDSQALKELMEILREPFESRCYQCSGSGKAKTGACPVCNGSGENRIDFV